MNMLTPENMRYFAQKIWKYLFRKYLDHVKSAGEKLHSLWCRINHFQNQIKSSGCIHGCYKTWTWTDKTQTYLYIDSIIHLFLNWPLSWNMPEFDMSNIWPKEEKWVTSLVFSVRTNCWGHIPHLTDLLSDLFAISEKQKMRHIYFVKLATRKQRKSLGKYQFFLGLFLALKRAANVRVISPNGLHIPSPTIGRGEAFCALERLWLKFTSFDRVALHISPEHNAQTLWQETKCGKFLNSEIKGCFAKKSSAEERAEYEGYSKLIGKLASRTAHFHNNR